MKSLFTLLFLLSLFSLSSFAQPYTGTWYMPDGRKGIMISLKEENGQFSGTFRGEGEVHQVQAKLEGRLLVGQVLGKPIRVTLHENGPLLELTLVDLKWGVTPDNSTARTYVLERQGDESSAAANYVTAGGGTGETVVFNGQVLSRNQLEDFRRKYRRYPRPGNYWYDPVSGLYGAVGFDAFGYLHPGHNFGPLLANASMGDTDFFVNGRCLTKREVVIWSQLMGRPMVPGSYWFDARGNFGRKGRRDSMFNFYDLGNIYTGGDLPEEYFWAAQFRRGRRGQNRDGFVSVPGFGPEGYGFGGYYEGMNLAPREKE